MADAGARATYEMHKAEGTARQTVRSPWAQAFARFGYASKGVVYLVLGALALAAAIGVRGGTAGDRNSTLLVIYRAPLGRGLLAVLAVGLVGFALWSVALATLNLDGERRGAQGTLKRLGYAIVGVSYLALAVAAFKTFADLGGPGKSSDQSVHDWTARVLGWPFGMELVVLAGVVLAGVALALGYEGVSGHFMLHFKRAELPPRRESLVRMLGLLGFLALAIIFALIALFLIVAALQHNPNEAKGLGGALQQLAQTPFGPQLLAAVSLGLAIYGLYSFAEARYRLLAGK